MTSAVTTSWMWPTSAGGVNGARIDADEGVIRWFDDAAACACGGSAVDQPFDGFIARGPAFPDIPADVLAEMRESLAVLR